MNTFKTLLVVLVCTVVLTAQTPAPKAPTLTDAQQKTLHEALDASDKARVELQAAQQRADTALQHFFALLYNVQAELQLKPSEWRVALGADGILSFERITTAKTEPLKEKQLK